MSSRATHSRLFVAVYPPPDAASQLASLLAEDRFPAARRTSLQQIHLTVFFIGNVAEKDCETTLESVERSCAGQASFSLQPRYLTTFPGQGPSRVIAVTTDAPPALLEIRSRLVQRIARHSRRRPNDRFRPHLTLARFAQPTKETLKESVELPPISIHEIQVMRSVLKPTGAEHIPVKAFELRR